MNEENIIPEASNLFYALRNSGYSNVAALEDLMDNSIDAGASNVRIFIDNMNKIIIADDGIGMSLETLRQAIKLGGKKEHVDSKELGKFGVGLITASISLGRKLTIITKHEHEFNTAIFDYDEIMETNKFRATFRESSDTEIMSFNFRTENAESGTVLIIDNCEKIQYDNIDDLVRELKASVKTVFRAFMREGKNIIINDVALEYDDPLFRDDPRTKVRLNKTIMINTDNGQEELQILAVTIPDFGKNINKTLHINIANQGFYVLRNSREIAAALELKEIFKKHNSLNLLRIELNFGPGLDDAMGINYTKHNISPNAVVINSIKRALDATITEVRNEIEKIQKKRLEERKKEKAENPFKKQGSEGSTETGKTGGSSESGKIEKPVETVKECKIGIRMKDAEAPLFETSISDGVASIRYNGANTYYKNTFVDNSDGVALKSNLDKVLEILTRACSENGISAETTVKLLDSIANKLN